MTPSKPAPVWAISTTTAPTHNQDAHAVLARSDGAWVVVADGASGRPDGARTAQLAVFGALPDLIAAPVGNVAAVAAVTAAERAIRAASGAGAIRSTALTALTVVGVTPAALVIAQRGDAPVLLAGRDGCRWLTEDSAAFVGPDVFADTWVRELGGLSPDDLLIVGTDGLNPAWPLLQMTRYFPAEPWTADTVVTSARAAGSTDDITVVMITAVDAELI